MSMRAKSMKQIVEHQSKYEQYARILEQCEDIQWYGQYKNPFGDEKCAVGVIMTSMGWDGKEKNVSTFSIPLRRDLGWKFTQIHYNNDVKRLTFKEIAGWLRQQK